MKAVLKLVFIYFTGTPLLAVTMALGVLAVVGGSVVYLYLPPLVGGQGGPSRFSLGVEALIFMTPVAGVIAVAFAASMLPTLFARLAASHYLYVLPYGRVKVLASVFVTLTLVALGRRRHDHDVLPAHADAARRRVRARLRRGAAHVQSAVRGAMAHGQEHLRDRHARRLDLPDRDDTRAATVHRVAVEIARRAIGSRRS